VLLVARMGLRILTVYAERGSKCATAAAHKLHLDAFYMRVPFAYIPFLCAHSYSGDGYRCGVDVMDFAYLALLAVLVVATLGFLSLCDRVKDRR
jgi:hypothetical protein